MTALQNTNFTEQLVSSIKWVLPEIALVGVACLLFTLAAFGLKRSAASVLALLGLVGAGALAVFYPDQLGRFEPAYSSIDPTGAAGFLRWFALVAGLVYLLLNWHEAGTETPSEYFACVLVMVAGLSVLGRSNDLVTMFLALEMLSIPTYVLLYLPVTSKLGQESAIKYFMLSVLSSGLLLFGFSYLFGLSGSTNLAVVVSALGAATQSGSTSPLALVAAIFVIAGLGFRLAAVPFHFYAPDVYEGGPTGVVAQLALVPKVAGFVALAKVFGLLGLHEHDLPFDVQHTLIPLTLWVVAVVTMCLGNLMALLQDQLKRIFAYSGIANSGYMLIGLLVAMTQPKAGANHSGMDVLFFYLVVYGLMTVGAFAILAHLKAGGKQVTTVDDLAGLGKSNPFAAFLMAVFFFSMIGLPLTGGFFGKLNLFFSSFDVPTGTKMRSMFQIIAVILAINAAVAAVYYLRVIGAMFLRSPLKPNEPTRWSFPFVAALLCGLGTVAIGMYPKPLLDITTLAAPTPTLPVKPAANP